MTMELSNRTIWRVLLIVSAYVGLLYLAYLLRRELTWVAAAGFLALALHPTVDAIARWLPRRSRVLATSLVFLASIFVIGFVVVALAPPAAHQTQSLIQDLPKYTERLESSDDVLSQYIRNQNLVDDVRHNQGQLISRLGGLSGSVPEILSNVFSSIVAVITTFVLAFFMLLEGPSLAAAFWRYHPPAHREHRQQLAAKMARTVTGYVNGNLLTSLVAAVATAVTLAIIGVPFAVPLGLLVGLIDLIPLIGATIAAVVIVLMTILFGSLTKALIMIVFFVIYQQLENHVLQPLVYSRTVKLSPLTVLVAGIFGVVLAGLLGALVAIPVAASVQILVQDYFENHSRKRA